MALVQVEVRQVHQPSQCLNVPFRVWGCVVKSGVDQRSEYQHECVALRAPPNLAPTPADRPTLKILAVEQVELHDLRERGEHSNVTWDERVCGWWEVHTHGHHTGAQLG